MDICYPYKMHRVDYIGPNIIVFGLENEKHKILVIIECVVEQIVQAFLEQ